MKPPSLDEKVDLSLPNKVVGPSITESPQAWSIPLRTVFLLWVITLFDPHIWLASYGAVFLRQIPAFIFMVLAVMIVLQLKARTWYNPLLLFMANAVLMSPFAENIGRTYALSVKVLFLYYILAIGSLTFIEDIDKTTLLLHMFFWQFLWFVAHANFSGRVAWHPHLGDEDGFAPLMVMGMGYSFYFGMATIKRALRVTAFVLFGLCIVGVVSSLARGAVIAGGVVLVWLWLRSPHRGRTFAAIVLAVGLFLVAADMLFPSGHYWERIASISEGTESGTGQDRWILWKTAWRVFLERPISGVGAGNFGVFAFEHLWADPEIAMLYHRGRLWGRSVHSVYFQTLSEFGLVGTIALAWLLIDFWRRNAQLRSAPFLNGWRLATGNRLDLRMLSLSLEAAMVGYLATGFFYDQVYVHWFYSLLTVNSLLHWNLKRIALQHPHPPV